MIYNIAAKPTRYKGVNFRSRLEARWAAFFDVREWRWEYEPAVEFFNWIPDFVISFPECPLFVEIKPVFPDSDFHWSKDESFSKAKQHWQSVQIFLLGNGPAFRSSWPGFAEIGRILDPPDNSSYSWHDLHTRIVFQCREISLREARNEIDTDWREAGNRTQWRAVSA